MHALKGYGDAIQGTFIDELLNTVTAGFNLHFGAEYPFTSSFRAYGVAKYEVLSDLQLFNLSVGWQIMTGPSAPGEDAKPQTSPVIGMFFTRIGANWG